jgi:hypothetical protein
MTKTIEMNGPTRKTLASQLDRLDSILDGLSEGLSDAVASAVREAVGLAVQEAVQAMLTELLTNPTLREQLQKAAPPDPPPPAERMPEGGGGRLAALCGLVGDKLRSACRAAAGWLRWAGQAVSLAWRLAGDRVRAVLLVAVAYLAHTTLPATARRLGDGAKSLASRAWGALRRALPRLALCGT